MAALGDSTSDAGDDDRDGEAQQQAAADDLCQRGDLRSDQTGDNACDHTGADSPRCAKALAEAGEEYDGCDGARKPAE